MNKKLIYGVVAAVVIVALSVAGVVWYTSSNNYVASVAGEKITKTEYNYFLKSVQDQMEQSADLPDENARKAFWTNNKIDGKNAALVAKENALENSKMFKILLMQAKQSKLSLTKSDDDQIKASIDSMIQQMGSRTAAEQNLKNEFDLTLTEYKEIRQNFALVNKFVAEEQKKVQMPDDEIKKYYDDNKSSFEKVTVRHVLFMTLDESGKPLPEDKQQEAKKKADEILAKVRNGEDIAALAKQYSEDPGSKDTGGEYTFERGKMVKEFEDWSFNAKDKDTGIVKTSYGYHVIKFEKKVQQTFDEVKDEIKSTLLDNKFKEQYAKQLEEWKKDPKYNLSINQKIYNSTQLK